MYMYIYTHLCIYIYVNTYFKCWNAGDVTSCEKKFDFRTAQLGVVKGRARFINGQ